MVDVFNLCVYENVPEKLTFYADSPIFRNKLYTFRIADYRSAYNLLLQFVANGNYIRSVWIKGFSRYSENSEPFQLSLKKSFINGLNEGRKESHGIFFLNLF